MYYNTGGDEAMYSEPSKKVLILNILDILKKYTDENHRLSQKEIIEKLEKEYMQKVERKAIRRNLDDLIDFGFDIEYTEIPRKNKKGEDVSMSNNWYLNRDFTEAELRLLIDSLLFSKHIPYNQCKELVEKLEGLASIYFQTKVKHIKTMPEKLPENKELFYTIEVLDEAISKKRRIQFNYVTNYGSDKKPLINKDKDGNAKIFESSPYQMAATNGRYYLICNVEPYKNIANYRIDRIKNIKLLDKPSTPKKDIPEIENGLNLPKFMAENIYMFPGESVRVKFRAKKYIIRDILDWFGSTQQQDVKFSNESEEELDVIVNVNEQAMLYWSLQYGEHMEVLEPKSLREKVGKAAKTISKKYK